MSAGETKPDIQSPEKHGWYKDENEWSPKFFEGQSAAELLEGLLCSCCGHSVCSNNCACANNQMGCTEECLCLGTEKCKNVLTHQPVENEQDQAE